MNTTVAIVLYLLTVLVAFVVFLYIETRNKKPVTDSDIDKYCLKALFWPYMVMYGLGYLIGTGLVKLIIHPAIVASMKVTDTVNAMKVKAARDSGSMLVLHIEKGNEYSCTQVDKEGTHHIILTIDGNWLDYEKHLMQFRGYRFNTINLGHSVRFEEIEWRRLRMLVSDEKDIKIDEGVV